MKLALFSCLVIISFGLGCFAPLPAKAEYAQTDSIDLRKTRYFEAGVTVGNPALLNLLAGYWFGKIGFRVSGLYWSNYLGLGYSLTGVEFNINYKLKDEYKILHSFGLEIGFYEDGLEERKFAIPRSGWIGPSYSLNWRGFFLQVCMPGVNWVRGKGGYRISRISGLIQPIRSLSIGYVHRFLPKHKY